jgi:hypothetical protein
MNTFFALFLAGAFLLRSIWFNTPQLAAVTGGAGDMFPRKDKDFLRRI